MLTAAAAGGPGDDVNDQTRVAGSGSCDCGDCRDYRLWRVEGTDEWEPNAERRDVALVSADAAFAASDWATDWRTTEYPSN